MGGQGARYSIVGILACELLNGVRTWREGKAFPYHYMHASAQGHLLQVSGLGLVFGGTNSLVEKRVTSSDQYRWHLFFMESVLEVAGPA